MQAALASLDGAPVDGFRLALRGLRAGRFPEEADFGLYLTDCSGRLSTGPVLEAGKYFHGRPPYLVPWVEGGLCWMVSFPGGPAADLSTGGPAAAVLARVGALLGPGGRLFLVCTGAGGGETSLALERGLPAAATPLGSLMWTAGFRWFKDWYFSEGGREGGRKLQGNLPRDTAEKQRWEGLAAAELEVFLAGLETGQGALLEAAAQRARRLLSAL